MGAFIHPTSPLDPGIVSRTGVSLPTYYRHSLDNDKASGWRRARSDPPFNISRLDWGGTWLYTFLLPIQSIPGAREGLDTQKRECMCTESQEPKRAHACPLLTAVQICAGRCYPVHPAAKVWAAEIFPPSPSGLL